MSCHHQWADDGVEIRERPLTPELAKRRELGEPLELGQVVVERYRCVNCGETIQSVMRDA